MGDNRLTPSSRGASWTRETKLWRHLQSHLEASRWRLKCPHPLCSLQLDDETSFLYHLSDIHSLRGSPHINKYPQKGYGSEIFIIETADTASHKRKRQDTDEQPRPSKQKVYHPKIHRMNEPLACHSLDRQAPDAIKTVSPHMLSKVSFTDIAGDNPPQDSPELTYSDPTSPPDSDD